jgi:CarD family transcriptional regulator
VFFSLKPVECPWFCESRVAIERGAVGKQSPPRVPAVAVEEVTTNRRQGRPRVFKVGDKVVYPHHGAGKIIKKEMKDVLGQQREYLTIQILYNEMTVMVPTENAETAGLRRVIDEKAVELVLAVLRDDGSQMPKNWNRRFKHNRDKIKTGDIFELAEVVRNLSIRDLDKGLSTGEKQMFGRAKKILASELMYARDMEEDEATEFLEKLLEDIGVGRADGASLEFDEAVLVD